MDFKTYQELFITILAAENPPSPYHKADYLNYVKLNQSRQQRWLKAGILNADLIDAAKRINEPQTWTIITEPWCGDAAHLVPFIQRIADTNPLITVDYVLRDTPPLLIESYLTNGTRSIPKLIIRDKDGDDLAVWGPRPAECQQLLKQMMADKVDPHEAKLVLQKWYNDDKGVKVQLELLELLNGIETGQKKVA